MSPNELCKVFGVKINTIYTLLRQVKRDGVVEKKKTIRKTLSTKVTREIRTKIYQEMDNNASLTYKAIQMKIQQSFHTTLHISTIARTLKDMLFTTKNLCVVLEERNTDRIKSIRKKYCTKE